MWDQIRLIDSVEGNVSKFVFTKNDAVAEAVLYRYPDYKTRTVICCSTMSGCPVGCRFCGAGNHFVRSLTGDEIVSQVVQALEEANIREGAQPAEMERLQIMFMSMGEPMLNHRGMTEALKQLSKMFPEAALLVSTTAPAVDYQWFINLSVAIDKIGLQFSIHESTDAARNELIPFNKKLSLAEIAEVGIWWWETTGRNPFINYCAHNNNTTPEDVARLQALFPAHIFKTTVSVICESNDGMPSRNNYQVSLASNFSELMVAAGYDVRVFDPAGQDDIGGGCGQLWFVQDWMLQHPDKARPSCGNGRKHIGAPRLLFANELS
jgi:23S rRNA (adenine2503-C2)-methyltransferase